MAEEVKSAESDARSVKLFEKEGKAAWDTAREAERRAEDRAQFVEDRLRSIENRARTAEEWA